MLSIVSNNNNLSQITRIAYAQIGLNGSENSSILRDFPKDEFIRATSTYQMCIDHTEDLTENLRPSLIKYMKGPFVLSIYNHGEDIEKSMLIFELQAIKPKTPITNEHGIILEDPMDFTSQSLAIIPFIDVFKTHINTEAERASRLINASKVSNLSDGRTKKDMDITMSMTQQFLSMLSTEEQKKKSTVKIGQEAISDVLSTSISAEKTFYNVLWQQMEKFYEPSLRYIGEEYALGRVSLESPAPIVS